MKKNKQEVYTISFVTVGPKGIRPSICLAVDKKHLDKVICRFNLSNERLSDISNNYFGVPGVFTPLNLSETTFGHNQCGHMEIDDHKVHLKFELMTNAEKPISLTMMALLRALNSVLYEEDKDFFTYPQPIQIDTACGFDMHGHPIGGYVFPKLGTWLRKQGLSIPKKDKEAFGRLRLPEVEDAMLSVWSTLLGRNFSKDAPYGFRATIAADGRFLLTCPGDACDVAIYPDQMTRGDDLEENLVEFSCHNLDSAIQQLTLLAGLAKLCDLAQDAQ